MGCAPVLNGQIVREIKKINPLFYVQWNHFKGIWEIWGRTPLGQKYLLMGIKNKDGSYRPIDNRTYSWLRYLMWYNNDIKYNLQKTIDDDETLRERNDERDKYFHFCMGEELYRPMWRFMRETGQVAGKTKIPVIQGMDFAK